MIKNKLYFLLVGFSISLFFAHYLVTLEIIPTKYNLTGLYKIHVFLFLITFTIIYIFEKIKIRFPSKFGYSYLLAVIVKMILSVAFLSQTILFNEKNKIFVLHFFFIFFSYLFIEVLFLNKINNRKN